MASPVMDVQWIQGLCASDVRTALKHSNPKAPVGDLSTMVEIIALVSNVIAELPKAERTELAREKDQVRRFLIDAISHGRADARAAIKVAGRIERSQGAGLGSRISLEEGRERLVRYAAARPLESWAGPVAGAGEWSARWASRDRR